MLAFDNLKMKLPVEQMQMAELRIPAMAALKGKLQELIE